MILTGIIAGIVTSVLILGGFFIAWRIISGKLSKIFREFVTPPGENQPSPFATLVDTIAQVFAQRITAIAKTSLLGMASVDARNQRSMVGEMAVGALKSKIPALGAILSAMPSLQKRLVKNPDLLDIIPQLLKGKNGEKHDEQLNMPLTS